MFNIKKLLIQRNILIDCGLFKLSYNLFKLKNKIIFIRCLLDELVINCTNFYMYFHLIIYNFFLNLKLFDILKKKSFLLFDLEYLSFYFNISKFTFYKIYSFYNYYTNFVFNCIYIKNIGINDKLNVTGYARKFWFSNNKTLLKLKVGRSYIDKIIIPKKIILTLVKKRLIKFYCSSKRLIKFFTIKIFNFQPSDPYKGEGIRLHSKGLFLKDRFIKK